MKDYEEHLTAEDIDIIKALLDKTCKWLSEGKIHIAKAQLLMIANYLEGKVYAKK